MRDVEEFSIQIERVSLDELRRVMYSGNMTPPSVIGAQMALNYLEGKGMLSADGPGTEEEAGAGMRAGAGKEPTNPTEKAC